MRIGYEVLIDLTHIYVFFVLHNPSFIFHDHRYDDHDDVIVQIENTYVVAVSTYFSF